MKKTTFDHHPVMITKGLLASGEDWAGQIMLEIISPYLGNGSLSTGWGTLFLATLVDTAGIDIPEGAAAIILDVEVQDVDALNNPYSLTFGYGGLIDVTNFPGRAFPVYTSKRNDEWTSRLVVLPLTDDNIIDYLAAASGGTTLDYRLRLIGWLILGEDYTKPTSQYEDLACGFVSVP